MTYPGRTPVVVLVSAVELQEPDVDEPLLVTALEGMGVDPRVVPWSADYDWASAGLCVLRSTWDYHHRSEEFLEWCDRAAAQTQLVNPAPIVRWNADKRYLEDLDAAGVPIVPTIWAPIAEDPGDLAARVAREIRTRGWKDVVIKPVVSAASYGTERFRAEDTAGIEWHLRWLYDEGRNAMVQQYLPSVEDHGERAVVVIANLVTHAVRKSPRFGRDDESVSGALPVADDELALAREALAAIPPELGAAEDLLYARVDIARQPDGTPCVMELELIEPSLFLEQHPPALDRLASAIVARFND